jgi:hypothetical protein
MRRTLLIALAALLCAVPGITADRLDLYTDQAMTQCSLFDNGGLQAVYVFLSGTEAATAVQFAAPLPACWEGARFLGDGFPGPRGPAGNSQIGIQVPLFAPGVGECKAPPVFVLTMYFQGAATAQPCCHMVVTPTMAYPLEPYQLEYLDCFFGEHPLLVGRSIVINPTVSCPCDLPVAVEPTTWGRVKSLYR